MSSLLFSILAAFIVSLVSLISIFFIFIKTSVLKKLTLFLVSFAIGGLLGDAFIHLLPEAFSEIKSQYYVSILIILGMMTFFVIEKVLRWRHCHEVDCHEADSKHVVTINLVGDAVHNLIDGMIIAASFIISVPVGISTTLAVILHEIPQEIGHFGIFVHNGLSVSRAIIYNCLSALASILGVFLTFLLGSNSSNFSLYMIPITAGGFIYLASSDLIPELHRHNVKLSHSFVQIFFILLGVSLMSLLIFLE